MHACYTNFGKYRGEKVGSVFPFIELMSVQILCFFKSISICVGIYGDFTKLIMP